MGWIARPKDLESTGRLDCGLKREFDQKAVGASLRWFRDDSRSQDGRRSGSNSPSFVPCPGLQLKSAHLKGLQSRLLKSRVCSSPQYMYMCWILLPSFQALQERGGAKFIAICVRRANMKSNIGSGVRVNAVPNSTNRACTRK